MVGGGISGSLDLEPNGSLRYTPGGGFSGTATFSYRVWDGLAWSGATTVTLTIAAPAPTPTPAPTRTPSPTATPSPTSTPLLPLPTSSASIPLPSIPLPWLPLPSLLPPTLPVPLLPLPPSSTQPSSTASASASPDTSPGATASPTPSATAVPGQSDGGPASSGSTVGAPPAGAGAGGGPAAASLGGSTGAERGDPGFRLPSTPFGDQRIDLAGASVGLFAGIEIWAVPAATIAFPGLLVLLWVALQTAGAAAWMPAVRRLRGEDDPRRRARLRTPSA